MSFLRRKTIEVTCKICGKKFHAKEGSIAAHDRLCAKCYAAKKLEDIKRKVGLK